MQTAKELQAELDAHGNPADAQFLQRFFKTGDGQYGAGDIFIGLRVPQTRKLAAKYRFLSLREVEKCLESPIHEHRLAALVIMTEQAKQAAKIADRRRQKALYDLYLRRTDRINNWDLVDISCRDVVGGYLLDKSRAPLSRLAGSDDIWERRIAMVSTWQFIRAGQLDDTWQIATLLLHDSHDLIQKAVGWMLREAGKKDETALKRFLDQHAATMPRTALRYTIERLHPTDRQHYLSAKNWADGVH